MDNTGSRLREVIGSQGVTLRKFCEKNNLNYSGMSNIINGERALGMNILRQLKESIPDLDVDWLLFGDTSKKLYINENTNVIQESTSDPGKEMLMRYLEDEDIQERILELITKKTK